MGTSSREDHGETLRGTTLWGTLVWTISRGSHQRDHTRKPMDGVPLCGSSGRIPLTEAPEKTSGHPQGYHYKQDSSGRENLWTAFRAISWDNLSGYSDAHYIGTPQGTPSEYLKWVQPRGDFTFSTHSWETLAGPIRKDTILGAKSWAHIEGTLTGIHQVVSKQGAPRGNRSNAAQ
jgi:hypothetical protein